MGLVTDFYANSRQQRHDVFGLYVCLSVVHLSVCYHLHIFHMTWCKIFLLSGGISVELVTNIHHVSGNCVKSFQRQRSKVVCEHDDDRGTHQCDIKGHLFSL